MAGNDKDKNKSNNWNDYSDDELPKRVKEFDDMRFPPPPDTSLSECGGPVTQPIKKISRPVLTNPCLQGDVKVTVVKQSRSQQKHIEICKAIFQWPKSRWIWIY